MYLFTNQTKTFMKEHTFSKLPLLPLAVGVITLCDALQLRAQSIPALDPNFRPVITRSGGAVSSVAVQKDGKLILAGAFNAINGVARNGMARLNADGTVDLTFDAGMGACCSTVITQTRIASSISAIALQADGKVILGGSFLSVNGTPRKGLARLHADGALDASFDPGAGLDSDQGSLPQGVVSAIAAQTDGKILIGGSFTGVGGVKHIGIARLNANGAVDVGFNPGAGATDDDGRPRQVSALALLSSGQVLIGGDFTYVDVAARSGLARLTAAGVPDPAFVPGIFQLDTTLPPPSVDGLAVQTDGKIVFSGSFEWVDQDNRRGVARINPDTTLDNAFNSSVNANNGDVFRVIGLQGDGKVIGYREFTDANGNSQRAIARLNSDGSLDATYVLALQPGLSGGLQIQRAVLQPDGQSLVVGNFAAGADATPRGIARVKSTGGLDAAFVPRLELSEELASHVQAVAAQKDGKVMIGGTFDRINGTPRGRLARLNRDGSLDDAFAPIIEPADSKHYVAQIAIQKDEKILISGWFTTVNGASRNSIARLNEDGSLDTSFDVGAGATDANGALGRVLALAAQEDDKIVLGGDFAMFNGIGAPWALRLKPDGSFDNWLSDGLNCLNCDTTEIRSFGVLTNGPIMMIGVFTRISGRAYNGFVRLLADGSVDPFFVSPATAEEQPIAQAVTSDDKTIIAILSPDLAGGANHTRLVRLKPDGTSDGSFNPGDILGDGSSAAPVSAISIDEQERILIGGAFVSIGGTARRGLARLKPDGTLDTNFDAGSGFANGVFSVAPNFHSRVAGIVRQDDGGIIVGGNFSAANGQVRLGVARFQAEPPSQSVGSRPVIYSPARTTDGTFSMTVSGEVGRAYRVEASTDLRTWSAIGNITGAATPQPFIDLGGKNLPHRFYRVVGSP